MKNARAAAISSLVPGAEFVLRGDTIEWLSAGSPPSEAQIAAEITRLENLEVAREAERAAIKADILANLPPQSLPALAARVAKIEQLLGLRPLSAG